jgi:hypothetical protein
VIKEEVASHYPYEEWLKKNLFSLDEWTAHAKGQELVARPYNLQER